MYRMVVQVSLIAAMVLTLGAGITHGAAQISPGNGHLVMGKLGENIQGYEEYQDEITGRIMVKIPEGSFLMGSSLGDSCERPVHETYLDEFLIDKHEVTNSAFCLFLNDRGNEREGGAAWLNIGSPFCLIEEKDGLFQPKTGFDLHPVVEVTWYGAAAYARWAGKRLPTEAEWEKAARGGLVQKHYPWGDEDPLGRVNYRGYHGEFMEKMPDFFDGRGPIPVGLVVVNGYGLCDMVSNVFEWCSDWYSPDYYAVSSRKNPKGPGDGELRVVRLGSWYSSPWGLRCSGRYYALPEDSNNSLGFRCAYSMVE